MTSESRRSSSFHFCAAALFMALSGCATTPPPPRLIDFAPDATEAAHDSFAKAVEHDAVIGSKRADEKAHEHYAQACVGNHPEACRRAEVLQAMIERRSSFPGWPDFVLAEENRDEIMSGILARKADLARCSRTGKGRGRVVVEFVIAPDGHVLRAILSQQEGDRPHLAACALHFFRSLEFPPGPERSKRVVQFPMLY